MFETFWKGRSVLTEQYSFFSQTERHTSNAIRAVDCCWECCDIAGGPWGYGCTWHGMRWHSGHGLGNMWAPKDSPVAGATRYCYGLIRRRTKGKTRRRTRLWRYISGKIVEPRSQKFQESSSSRDGDMRLGWLAPPALRLALSYICMRSHPLCQEHSLPTWRHPCLRVELRGPATKVSWVIFGSGVS